MNNNYNNLYGDYIGATGVYSISDYIDITSNTLAINSSNFTLGTSNILKLYTDTNIINLDNKYNELINQKTEIETFLGINYNVKHTYINNSNLDNPFSEIRFYSKNAINYPTYEITASPIYKVKIGNDGKLYIWYSYNPFISLTLISQWIDLNQEIGRQQADGLNQGSAIVALENQVILINSTLTAISGELTSLYGLASGSGGYGGLSGSAYNVPRLNNGIITTAEIDSIRNNLITRAQTVQNYITNLGGATPVLAVIYGIAEGFGRSRYVNTMIDQLTSNLNSNIAIGNTQNAQIISNTMIYTSNNYLISNLKDIYDNYSNLSLLQGFINCNIQTQQTISNIFTSNITAVYANINNIYNKTETDNLLNVKDSILTFASPLVRTTNNITFNEASITTLTNFYNKTNSDGRYLQLTGGSMTGQITGITTLNGTTGIFGTIATTNNTNQAIPALGVAGGVGDKYIIQAGTISTYPYSIGFETNSLWLSSPNTIKLYNNGFNSILINSSGRVGIGTTDPKELLHVVGKAIIHNGVGLPPANGLYGSGGTRIILWPGADNNTPYSLGIAGATLWYTVPTGANHIFYVGTTERMRINDAGNILTSGNIDCGGGIAINGSNAFYFTSDIVDAGNKTNTYINFKQAGTNNDWCYLRQIGGDNTYKLAFDFHDDDADARFCIRKIQSTASPDIVKEVFLVDNGNITCTGNIYMGTDNAYPDIRLGSADGNNLAIATGASGFSQSASAGDMVIRSINRLILQSGSGGAAFVIDTANNILVNSLSLTNAIYFKTDLYNKSTDGKDRFWFATNAATYYRGHGGVDYTTIHEWRNKDDAKIMELDNLGNLTCQYQFKCRVYTIANANRDLLGINFENTTNGSNRLAVIYAIQGTFTGFHRVFTEDEKFNKEEPQIFKDEYEGRIVISTGKIATDTNPTDKEWIIEYDKAGITIEDALPMVELSRKKKDKRVFGVLGDKRRSNSRAERLIINSVGEGALWVCNSNGNIENGDYITSSDYLGYGEKQDEIYLCNFTVAKATMDCNFELDSPLYECKEIESGLRVAFIAVSYHCG